MTDGMWGPRGRGAKDDSRLGDVAMGSSVISKGAAEREAGLEGSVGWGRPVLWPEDASHPVPPNTASFGTPSRQWSPGNKHSPPPTMPTWREQVGCEEERPQHQIPVARDRVPRGIRTPFTWLPSSHSPHPQVLRRFGGSPGDTMPRTPLQIIKWDLVSHCPSIVLQSIHCLALQPCAGPVQDARTLP